MPTGASFSRRSGGAVPFIGLFLRRRDDPFGAELLGFRRLAHGVSPLRLVGARPRLPLLAPRIPVRHPLPAPRCAPPHRTTPAPAAAEPPLPRHP
ncbi:MAG: hypothetical protein MJ061_05745, partial [Mailhella sp.]|nr:hypothetical protein [Mailhella sp.]